MGPRHTIFFISISPPPYEKKNATKVYSEGTKPIISEYEENISGLGKVRQKLDNNLIFLQKYQLHQISTSPNINFTQINSTERSTPISLNWHQSEHHHVSV